jgi:hypothetical protein
MLRTLDVPAFRVRVAPLNFTERASAEIRQRLDGRLDAQVVVQSLGVIVVTVGSSAGAANAAAIVRDVVHGVRQTFALDTLDQELRQVSFRIDEVRFLNRFGRPDLSGRLG